MATSRSSRVSRRAVDLAHPAAPSSATISYGPRRVPGGRAKVFGDYTSGIDARGRLVLTP